MLAVWGPSEVKLGRLLNISRNIVSWTRHDDRFHSAPRCGIVNDAAMSRTPDDYALLEAIGARIAEVRKERELTQAAVAEIAGLDPQSFQRGETGRSALSVPRLRRIAAALGVPVASLFESVGDQVPPSPWSADEVTVAAAWRRIPADRRELALRLLADLAR